MKFAFVGYDWRQQLLSKSPYSGLTCRTHPELLVGITGQRRWNCHNCLTSIKCTSQEWYHGWFFPSKNDLLRPTKASLHWPPNKPGCVYFILFVYRMITHNIEYATINSYVTTWIQQVLMGHDFNLCISRFDCRSFRAIFFLYFWSSFRFFPNFCMNICLSQPDEQIFQPQNLPTDQKSKN